MALDFLNSLQIEEQPLLNLSEVENKSAAPSDITDKSTEDPVDSVTDNGNPSDLLPITEISTDDDLEDLKPNNSGTNSSSDKKPDAKSSSKKYAAIIKALHEKTGAFEDFNEEDFEDSPESFLDYLDTYAYKNAENLANEYIQKNLNPLQQKFIDLVESGISEEDAGDLVKGYKLSDNITEDTLTENPEKAKKLFSEYLKYTTSFSEERIKKEVEKREDLGTLVDDALEILPEFKEVLSNAEEQLKENLKARDLQQKEFQARQAKELQEYLESTEEIAGIKLTKKMKENWMKEYSVIKTEDGRQLNPILATREVDPNKFDALLRLYHTIGLFKYDARKKDFVPDFSVLKSLGKTEAIKELHNAVESDSLKRRTGHADYDSMELDVDKEEHKKRWAELSKKLNINK